MLKANTAGFSSRADGIAVRAYTYVFFSVAIREIRVLP